MVREMNGGVGDVGGEDWTEEESVNGGNDVWSSSRPADHLVVMVHGILGRLFFSLDFRMDCSFLLFVLAVASLSCCSVWLRRGFDLSEENPNFL